MRLICAYPAANLYLDAYAAHLTEMQSMGFDTVVLCVPEHYVVHHLASVFSLIAVTRAAGLKCWVDSWRVAGVFDGEAPFTPPASPAAADAAVRRWIAAVASGPPAARPDAVFLDNPNPAVPSQIAAWAAQARGLGVGTQVCLSADRHDGDLDLFRRVARIDAVDGISTDPYCLSGRPDFPIEEYAGQWAHDLAEIAGAAGKEAAIWCQGFGIPEGQEDWPVRAAEAAREQMVDGVGFWPFRAGELMPNRPARHEEVWRRFGTWLRGRTTAQVVGTADLVKD
jgi:hypothetical protein